MLLMVLLRLMITMKSAYTKAEPNERSTPMKLISWVESLCVMMMTPTNVATMASHTCHEGMTRRKTMISATSTGYRKMSVVANPDGIYL